MQVREHEQIIPRVSNICFLPFELLRNTLPLVTFSPIWLPAMFLCANRTCSELSGVYRIGLGCSSRERVVIQRCAVGSQTVPLNCSVLGGSAFTLQHICLHPTQISWHLIFTTLNHLCDKHKTKVSGNVVYTNPTPFALLPYSQIPLSRLHQ